MSNLEMQSKAVSLQKSAQILIKENKGTDFVIITDNLIKSCGNCAVINSTNSKVPKSASRIDDSLFLVELKELTPEKINSFSEEEEQHLCNSQSIINEPKLLTFEKPTTLFDPMVNQAILKIMKNLVILSKLSLKSYLSVYFPYNYILNHLENTFNRYKFKKKLIR